MPQDLQIEPEGEAEQGPQEREHLSPHPWWSRLLYFLYGAVSVGAAVVAVLHDKTELAYPAGGVALVLFWKAAQRAR